MSIIHSVRYLILFLVSETLPVKFMFSFWAFPSIRNYKSDEGTKLDSVNGLIHQLMMESSTYLRWSTWIIRLILIDRALSGRSV